MRALVERLAERRARERSEALARRLSEALPRGIEAQAVPEGVRISGRGLKRRMALEKGLRWLVGELK